MKAVTMCPLFSPVVGFDVFEKEGRSASFFLVSSHLAASPVHPTKCNRFLFKKQYLILTARFSQLQMELI